MNRIIVLIAFSFFVAYSLPLNTIATISNDSSLNKKVNMTKTKTDTTIKDSLKNEKQKTTDSADKQKKIPDWVIALLSALFGALIGISPFLYNKLRAPQFYGKLVGLNITIDQRYTFEKDWEGNCKLPRTSAI